MHSSIITLDDDGGLIVGGALLIEYRQDKTLLAPEKDGTFLVHCAIMYNYFKAERFVLMSQQSNTNDILLHVIFQITFVLFRVAF